MLQMPFGSLSVQGKAVGIRSVQDIRAEKQELRTLNLRKRAEIDACFRLECDKKIEELLLKSASYRYTKKILLYASAKGEPDTMNFASKAILDGRELYFPKSYAKGVMRFFKVSDLGKLTAGKFGILEPSEDSEEYSESISGTDLCIVPGLCFDLCGYRIGYGKGYYDRFLSGFSGVTVGLTYSLLLSDNPLPREKRYDKSVDVIITERGIITVEGRK